MSDEKVETPEERMTREIGEMEDTLEGVGISVDPEPEPDPTPEPDPEPSTDPEPEPEPEGDPKPEPKPDPEPKPEPDPEPKEDTVESLRAEKDELRKRLDASSVPTEPTPEPDPTPEPTPEPEPEPTPEVIEPIDFTKDLDLEELIRDPEEFNKLLNTVHQAGITMTRTEIRAGDEAVINSTPETVRNLIKVSKALAEESDLFYADNKELIPFKTTVAAVWEEVIAENPDKPRSDILAEVATKTREKLELKKAAIEKDKEDKPPNLPGANKGGKRQQTKPNTTSFEAEIAEMDEALDSQT